MHFIYLSSQKLFDVIDVDNMSDSIYSLYLFTFINKLHI